MSKIIFSFMVVRVSLKNFSIYSCSWLPPRPGICLSFNSLSGRYIPLVICKKQRCRYSRVTFIVNPHPGLSDRSEKLVHWGIALVTMA